MKKTNTSPGFCPALQGRPQVVDAVNYRSLDGAVEILTKVKTARRHPQHDYPIVCIRVHPEKGTRIQALPETNGVEILLSHVEVVKHLQALNAADPKARYTWQDIPEKPATRKAYWGEINRYRTGKKSRSK